MNSDGDQDDIRSARSDVEDVEDHRSSADNHPRAGERNSRQDASGDSPQAPPNQAPANQAPPNQAPPNQAPANQAPPNQAPQATSTLPSAPEANATPLTVVPKWVQLVTLPLAIVALWALARAAGNVLLIFIVAAVIGLILNPAVALLQGRARLPRGLAVLTVYLGFFVALAAIGYLLANPISNQVQAFIHSVPQLVREAEHALSGFQRTLDKAGINVKLVGHGKTVLQTLREHVVKSASSLVSFGGGLLADAAAAIVDVVLVFVISVYLLLYGQRIGALVRKHMPAGDRTPQDDYPHLVQNAVSRYVGGQLLFSLIMGTTAGVALYIYGVVGLFPDGRTYAIAFGAFVAVMELIPYVGPVLGALPPVLVALFTDPITAVWVALLFIGIQQFEGHVVAPQIFGHSLRINPLIVMFALLLGEQIYGLVGALVALPIAAIIRETFVYLNRHLAFERWDRNKGGLL